MSTEIRVDVFRRIVEQTTDAIIFADREGLIRIWNQGAESVFGFPARDVLGKRLDVIIPEELRKKHWEGYSKAIETGKTKLGSRVLTTRSRHKDESRLYVDLSFTVIVDDSGHAEGALAIGRNVTERYLADKAHRKRTAELENRMKPSEQNASPHILKSQAPGGEH
jgi:PAS domain S-box-containing protein